MTEQPFRIDVAEATLTDLRARLARTRWPDAVAREPWRDGADLHFMRELVEYWQKGFDWRAQEALLNRLPQRTAILADGFQLHFLHARSTPRKLPLLLLHGWPGSFYQMSKVLPMLTDPQGHGGDAADGFDVVVPSLPGFGFSAHPVEPGMTLAVMASLIDELMTKTLGYARYGVAAGDIGATIARQLVSQFPAHVLGFETHGDSPHIANVPPDLSAAEQSFVERADAWMKSEGAYLQVQATKPQTAALGLTDSPAACAAWLIEKYRAWSDCGLPDGSRDVLRRFSRDELLTFVTLYWVTETMASSMRTYFENAQQPSVYSPPRPVAGEEPPAGNIVWPGDICQPPREWSARRANLQRYTVMPRGGHFPEWEEPELVATELRAFFRPLRSR